MHEVIDQISATKHNRHANQQRHNKHRHISLLFLSSLRMTTPLLNFGSRFAPNVN